MANEKKPPLEGEFARLQGEAAGLDAEGQVERDGEQPAGADFAGEAKMLVAFLVGVAAPFYPCVKKIWTDEKQAAVAVAAAPVMEKYGFDMGEFFGQWGAEINLALVAGPLVLATVDAVQAERAAAKQGAQAPKEPMPEAEPAPAL
jgi:hypothetical protein